MSFSLRSSFLFLMSLTILASTPAFADYYKWADDLTCHLYADSGRDKGAVGDGNCGADTYAWNDKDLLCHRLAGNGRDKGAVGDNNCGEDKFSWNEKDLLCHKLAANGRDKGAVGDGNCGNEFYAWVQDLTCHRFAGNKRDKGQVGDGNCKTVVRKIDLATGEESEIPAPSVASVPVTEPAPEAPVAEKALAETPAPTEQPVAVVYESSHSSSTTITVGGDDSENKHIDKRGALKLGVSEKGFQGGLLMRYSGKKDTRLEGSELTLDLVGGKPALRLSGSAEIIPVTLWTPVSYSVPGAGWAAVGGVRLQIIPVTAQGKLTLDSFSKSENGRLGNTHVYVSPSLAAKYGHLSAFSGGLFALGVQARGGCAIGVARDDDGMSKVFSPEVGGNVTALLQLGAHGFSVEANGGKVLSRQLELDPTLSLGGALGYSYGGLRFKAEATYDKVNVKSVDGATEKADGKSLFVGGSAGFAW